MTSEVRNCAGLIRTVNALYLHGQMVLRGVKFYL